MSNLDKTRFAVDWENIKGNLVWLAFRAKVNERRENSRDNCSITTDEIELRRNQGKTEAYRYILALMEQPEKLLEKLFNETTAKSAN